MSDINRLREHVDRLFVDAPPTRKAAELKEEILQNLTDKYNDLVAEGKSTEAAYHIAVASIGDVSQIVGELSGAPAYTPEQERELKEYFSRKAKTTAIAVALYILSPVPIIMLQNTLGVLLLLALAAIATALLVYQSINKPVFLAEEGTVFALLSS